MDYNISEDLINSLAEKNFRVKYLFPYQRLVIFNILDIVSGRNEEFPVPPDCNSPDRGGEISLFHASFTADKKNLL